MRPVHFVALAVGPLGAQDPVDWTVLANGTPPARLQHGVAYDSQRSMVVLFGGNSPSGLLNDTWEYNGTSWVQRSPANNPPPRSGFGMAFDPVRGRTVLFGGRGAGGATWLNDTWEWDGTNWLLVPAIGPSPRYLCALAYDGVGILLFGGSGASGTLNDTWTWDGTSWAQVTTVVTPPARDAHAMAYQPWRDRVLLCGGASGTTLNDTWEWDGTTRRWLQASPPMPCPTVHNHALSADSLRCRVVLFGGLTNAMGTLLPPTRTWEWDGTTWLNRQPSFPIAGPPAARYGHRMAFDALRLKTVLYGGAGTATFADTWSYQTLFPASALPSGTGCPVRPGVGIGPVGKSLPWIGETFTVQLRGATPVAPTAFLLGLPLAPEFQLCVNCFVCTSGLLTINLGTDFSGTATVGVPIPSNPALRGFVFATQFFFLDANSACLSVAGTRCLRGVIGER